MTARYSELMQAVRSAGLLDRCYRFYAVLTAVLTVALTGLVAAVLAVGDSWFQLVLAAASGLVLVQFGFLAHEAAHREIFASGPANDRAGRVLADLVVGISYSWWKDNHHRHHATPNVPGHDPSIEPGAVVFTEDAAARTRGVHAWYTRRQGYFFFPILLLSGVNLYVEGFRTVLGRGKVNQRAAEIAMLLARHVVLVAGLLWFLPVGKALTFLGVQLVTFGVGTASSFVPNHIGMPILPGQARADFLRRQVVTARNIRGGALTTAWMGGLNYQIEHHLFPSMARPQLARASALVSQYCASHDIPYTRTGLLEAYGIIVRHLNQVGLSAARHPYRCPTSSALGR